MFAKLTCSLYYRSFYSYCTLVLQYSYSTESFAVRVLCTELCTSTAQNRVHSVLYELQYAIIVQLYREGGRDDKIGVFFGAAHVSLSPHRTKIRGDI